MSALVDGRKSSAATFSLAHDDPTEFRKRSAGLQRETHALERDHVQVLLVGETRVWETVKYAADAVTHGRDKALIVIGHTPSEQGGMEECTRWLKGFVTKVPVEFVAAKEPFWTVSEKQ